MNMKNMYIKTFNFGADLIHQSIFAKCGNREFFNQIQWPDFANCFGPCGEQKMCMDWDYE